MYKRNEISRMFKMHISELKTRLNELGIEEYKYNLDDKSLSELELGILKGGGTWKVYQSLERGGMNIIDSETGNVATKFEFNKKIGWVMAD
jgi:hypothetical protein